MTDKSQTRCCRCKTARATVRIQGAQYCDACGAMEPRWMERVRIAAALLLLSLTCGCLKVPAPTPEPGPPNSGVYHEGFVAERTLKARVWRDAQKRAQTNEFASDRAFLDWWNKQIEVANATAWQPSLDEIQARIGGDKWSNDRLAELADDFASQAEGDQ